MLCVCVSRAEFVYFRVSRVLASLLFVLPKPISPLTLIDSAFGWIGVPILRVLVAGRMSSLRSSHIGAETTFLPDFEVHS